MRTPIRGTHAKCGAQLFLTLGLIVALAAPAPANPTGVRLVLPGGTPVTFQVVDEVSSATANVGDTFAVRVTKDVVVDGWVAIARGADGMGEVMKVDRAGSHGHPGSLAIVLDWVRDADGHQVRLTAEQKSEQGEGDQGKSSTATVLSYLVLGPVGLFTHNFVKGHEMELTPDNTLDHPLMAYVDVGAYVVATTQVNNGFAPAVEAQNPAVPSQQSAGATAPFVSTGASAPANPPATASSSQQIARTSTSVSTLSVSPEKLLFSEIGVGYERYFQIAHVNQIKLQQSNNCSNVAVVELSIHSDATDIYMVRAFANGTCQVRVKDELGEVVNVNIEVRSPGPL